MPNLATPPNEQDSDVTYPIAGPIVAGDGYIYAAYDSELQLTGGASSIQSVHVIRISSSGAYTDIPIQEATWPHGCITSYQGNLITNADTGALFTFERTFMPADSPADCPQPVEGLATITGTTATVTDGVQVPGMTYGPVVPALQAEDGSFVGWYISGTWDTGTPQINTVAFDASGTVRWTVQNEVPQIATESGEVIGQSGVIYDANGNVTGQAKLPTYSWAGNAYQQAGSVEQVSANLLFDLFDIATSFWPITAGNYSGNESAYALVRAFQDNVVNSNVYVTNPSQTNPNQQTITDVLNKVMQALNSGTNEKCADWLKGTASNTASYYINILIGNQSYGHGTFNDVRTSAISGGRNKDDSLVGVPVNFAFTVNDQGAFFNAKWGEKNFTVSPKGYPGGTLKAQAEILVHEVAHQMKPGGGAEGFQSDAGIPEAGRDNEKLVWRYCSRLIEGIQ